MSESVATMDSAPRPAPWRDLLGIPGDAAAGALLAGACLGKGVSTAHLLAVMAVYLLLHLAGRRLGAAIEPRPIPSPGTGRSLLYATVFAAIGLAGAQCLRPILLSLGLLYLSMLVLHHYVRPTAAIGPLTAGLCRTLGLLFGAAAGGGISCPLALLSAGFLLVYAAAAEHLDRRGPSALTRCLPAFVLAVWMVDLQFLAIPGTTLQQAALAVLGLAVVILAWRAKGPGKLIALLLPLQAAMALACPMPGPVLGVLLLLAWWIIARAPRP